MFPVKYRFVLRRMTQGALSQYPSPHSARADLQSVEAAFKDHSIRLVEYCQGRRDKPYQQPFWSYLSSPAYTSQFFRELAA